MKGKGEEVRDRDGKGWRWNGMEGWLNSEAGMGKGVRKMI